MPKEEVQPVTASLWHRHEDTDDVVRCDLCSFRCIIRPSQLGICQVRKNIAGQLYTLNYHAVTAWHDDPIEKKPLFHFLPGTQTFSLACAGCNFRCSFCQNWRISQSPRQFKVIGGQSIPPGEMVAAAARAGCRSMAYTYTEPTIFMEYAWDCAKLAVEAGMKNVFVSNGFMTIEAIEHIRPYLHAINVDLKSFSDDYYRTQTGGMLEPVLETLRHLVHKTDIWTEVTTLLVPGANDSDEELRRLAGFIAGDLAPHVPWHVSRFHPNYRMTDRPATPEATIRRALDTGRAAGLRYVYAGNVWAGDDTESTGCHGCGQMLIERHGYVIMANRLTNGNRCPKCATPIAGVFQ